MHFSTSPQKNGHLQSAISKVFTRSFHITKDSGPVVEKFTNLLMAMLRMSLRLFKIQKWMNIILHSILSTLQKKNSTEVGFQHYVNLLLMVLQRKWQCTRYIILLIGPVIFHTRVFEYKNLRLFSMNLILNHGLLLCLINYHVGVNGHSYVKQKQVFEIDPSPLEMNFVGYPPVQYQNRQYAELMIYYSAISLFVTLLVKDEAL